MSSFVFLSRTLTTYEYGLISPESVVVGAVVVDVEVEVTLEVDVAVVVVTVVVADVVVVVVVVVVSLPAGTHTASKKMPTPGFAPSIKYSSPG